MKNVTIHRAQKNSDNPYAITLKATAEDSRLTWEARGVLWYLLVKPDDWKPRLMDIVRQGPAGRDKVTRIFRELENFSYLQRIENSRPDGRFAANDFLVHESPPLRENRIGLSATEKPLRENRIGSPATEKPEHTKQQSLLNTNILNTNILNTNSTKDTNVLNNNNKHARLDRVDNDLDTPPTDVVVVSDSVQKLIDYGFTENDANEFLKHYGEEYIQEKILILEERIESGVEVGSTGGFLARAISSDWKPKKRVKPIETDPTKMTARQLRDKYVPAEYANIIRG